MPIPCHPDPSTRRTGPSPMDNGLEAALNAFAIIFSDRWPAVETY